MAITATNTNKRTLNKITRILVTPYDGDAKGSAVYALDNVVADSTSITQDEADRSSIDCETRDEPITEAVTLGSYKFTCDNADWQDVLMTSCLGFTKDNTTGVVYAPETYKELYAEIELQFGVADDYNASSPDKGGYRGSIVLPKVLLSSAATMESMKTSTANMSVAGTAYSGPIKGVSNKTAPFYYSPAPVAE